MKSIWIVLLCAASVVAQVLPQGVRSILTYSTYLGGGGIDIPRAIATDAQGNVYIAGETASANFPVTAGALRQTSGGTPGTTYSVFTGNAVADSFITKLDASGKVVFSTYLGAPSVARAIAVDAQGNVYVAGSTDATNFPTTSGAFKTRLASQRTDGFIVKLNASGSALVYATLLGGSGGESIAAIRLDAAGNVFVTGNTSSTDFPVTTGAFQTTASAIESHGYVVKLNAAGSALLYGTYLSGTRGSSSAAMALTSGGEVLVTGNTSSTDFPRTSGAYQVAPNSEGPFTNFVSRLNASGTALVYSTFLGGSNTTAIDVDSTGAAYVTGAANSTGGSVGTASFPVTPGGLASQTTFGAFVAKLNPGGTNLVYGALLGGDGFSQPAAIAVDSLGNAFITGTTQASNFPLSSDAYQQGYSASQCLAVSNTPFGSSVGRLNCGDVFLAELDPAGTRLVYSTYFGSNGPDAGTALALAPGGGVWLAGSTQSSNLPTTATGFGTHRALGVDCNFVGSPTASGSNPCEDGFVARFHPPTGASVAPFELVNGASFLPGAISAGELIALFGPGIGPARSSEVQLDANGRVTTSLNGIRVLFDGVPGPLLYVGPNQINVMPPYGIASKQSVSVVIETNGVAGAAQQIQVAQVTPGTAAVAPGVLSLAASGAGQAAAFNQDGTVNGPANPAPVGSVVGFYATGLGPTNPPSVDGQVTSASLLPLIAGPVEVLVGGQRAEVQYAGAAPGMVAGITQINIRIPQGITGRAAVHISAGRFVASQSGIWITVR